MNKSVISLNGEWKMDYISASPYMGEAEPSFKGFSVKNAVPAYFEDMLDEFRKTDIHTRLSYNPLYTLQRYPQSGYVPDMALPNVIGCFAYRKSFILDKTPETNASLYFGGVQNTVSVWINCRFIGRREGYSSCFSMDIPEGILNIGENTVTLAVSNNRLNGYMDRPVSGLTSRAANECSGGIYGDIELRFFSDGICDLWVTTEKDLSAFTVHTEGGEGVSKHIAVHGESGALFSTDTYKCSVTVPADGFKLWSPREPKLYTVTVTTMNGYLSRRFGIRRLTSVGDRLFLNGKPYYFRGACEHCYHPITVHPTREKNYYRGVIRTLKELGFNSIRFHTYVPPMEYMEAADELGMLIEVETPNNTTYAEWRDIVRMARRYTSPIMYSSGNEMVIDEDYIEHLGKCAELVHSETDSLFSPMSAMRGIEYHSYGDTRVETPFPHNPKRLAALSKFCDAYNTYSLGLTSYESDIGEQAVLDERNSIYGRPLLSHEICIGGTYCDLSLADRYEGSRIGDTELFTSVKRHLSDKGLLDRAPLYYRNSCLWQAELRKDCFETVRLCKTFSGYDFLGDIDTHWHTFGYCVGMMNEFYELKPGETRDNVLRYNSDTVLLAELPKSRNYCSGEKIEIPVTVSHFGDDLRSAMLRLRLSDGTKVYLRKSIRVSDLASGEIRRLAALSVKLPKTERPTRLTLTATLSGGNTDAENRWDIFVFPKPKSRLTPELTSAHRLTVRCDISASELTERLKNGERVLLLGSGPFASVPTSYQIALAGRTHGHLATVIRDHPLTEALPSDGFCGREFREMLNGGEAVLLDLPDIPFEPIIEIAGSYKNARREALLFEYRVGNGALTVCSLNLQADDAAARWLKNELIRYAASSEPANSLTFAQLASLMNAENVDIETNENSAQNKNDITMI